jgi:hypothetical protein
MNKSGMLDNELMLKANSLDNEQTLEQKRGRWHSLLWDGKAHMDLENGQWRTEQSQTLFVNACITDSQYNAIHPSWIVDLALPMAASSH